MFLIYPLFVLSIVSPATNLHFIVQLLILVCILLFLCLMEICPYCLEIDLNNSPEKTKELRNLPFLNISSPVSNIPHLTNLDIDLHMPAEHNYYTAHVS